MSDNTVLEVDDCCQGLGLTIGGVVVGVLVLMRLFASQVYDVVIISMTEKWYHAVLSRFGDKERVLDIGIGTATALLRNKELVQKKSLSFVGVDYDAQYVKSAKKKVAEAGLESVVTVHCKSIFDTELGPTIKKESEQPFDAAYFSGSWSLMPNPVGALHVAASFVKPDGRVYVTQTFQRASSPFMSVIKPLLKYVTTIDFGNLHYESDLDRYIKEAETPVDGISLKAEEHTLVPGSIDNRFQAAHLIVFQKVKA